MTHIRRRNELSAVLSSLALISGMTNAHPVHGQQPPAAETTAPGAVEFVPRGQRIARDIKYGDWKKFCFKPGGTNAVCRTTISGTFETGQTAVRVDLVEREGETNARLQLFLPVGVYLQSGVNLSVDQGRSYRIPYVWCLTNACIAADLADTSLLKDMETGQTLLLRVVDTSIISVTTQIPLTNFASTRLKEATKTFEQAIEE